jgi:hypothetical protein
VGRHVLVGSLAGGLCATLLLLADRLPAWLGLPASPPDGYALDLLLGPRQALATLVGQQLEAVGMALGLLLLLVLLRGLVQLVQSALEFVVRGDGPRALLRRLMGGEWVAALVLALIMGIQTSLQSELPLGLAVILCVGAWASLAFVALRHGLLALCSAVFFMAVLVNFPLALDLSQWTAVGSLLTLAAALGLVVFCFKTSLAGRPLLRDDLLEG